MTLQFTIYGRAQQRGSKIASLIPKRGGGWVEKNGRPIVAARDSNKKSKDWMQQVRAAAFEVYGPQPLLDCPIVLTARFYFSRPNRITAAARTQINSRHQPRYITHNHRTSRSCCDRLRTL